MKRMKKLTSIGLVLAMTVGLLAGCSGTVSYTHLMGHQKFCEVPERTDER